MKFCRVCRSPTLTLNPATAVFYLTALDKSYGLPTWICLSRQGKLPARKPSICSTEPTSSPYFTTSDLFIQQTEPRVPKTYFPSLQVSKRYLPCRECWRRDRVPDGTTKKCNCSNYVAR